MGKRGMGAYLLYGLRAYGSKRTATARERAGDGGGGGRSESDGKVDFICRKVNNSNKMLFSDFYNIKMRVKGSFVHQILVIDQLDIVKSIEY